MWVFGYMVEVGLAGYTATLALVEAGARYTDCTDSEG